MNKEGHRKKAEEIERSIKELLPDEEGNHVVAIVELTYGIIQHLIAYGMENKYGRHRNSHVGLCKELRELGEERITNIFETLDTFRIGRWYGGKGNGDIVRKCQLFIQEVKEWVK